MWLSKIDSKRPWKILGFTLCLLLQLIIRWFSHVWKSGIPHTPKNVVCWARALQKSVSSKLLSSEASWNCCQPPKPTLSIVFKGFLIKYLPENGLMCVSNIHKCLLAPLQMTSDKGNSSCMAQRFCNNAQTQVPKRGTTTKAMLGSGKKRFYWQLSLKYLKHLEISGVLVSFLYLMIFLGWFSPAKIWFYF